MNNAGIANHAPGLTTDGYEIQFGTNHMGHALLTKFLMPLLLKTAKQAKNSDVRIINLTSNGHAFPPKGGFIPEACKTNMADYYTFTRYGQSKLANILFTKALTKRYPGITSVAVHPGGVNTDLPADIQARHPWWAWFLHPLLYLLKSPEVGALTQVYAAVGDGAQGSRYYVPTAQLGSESQYARDEGLVKRLWEWTERELERQGY